VLDLVREYENEHDSNAVAVYWEGNKLGFLPMGENVSLAYMMDHGLLLQCHVVYTQPGAQHWEQCFIAVELLVPSNPSFDAYLDHYMDRDDAGYKRRPEYGGVVELPTELQPKDNADRVYKQQAALQLLGELRFVRFLKFLGQGGEHRPAAVVRLLRKVEASGIGILERTFQERVDVLEVRQLNADRFEVTFGHGPGDCSDGGTWLVASNAAHEIISAEQTAFWRP